MKYILDTFPIVRRKDEAQHSECRTKRVILEIYDEMRQAMGDGATGRMQNPQSAFVTRLDPPPANVWTPPELRDGETGGENDGEKEAPVSGFQLRAEDARPQPGLFDEGK